MAAVSGCLLTPHAVAQYSSSAQYTQQLETVIQDRYPNQGGYPHQQGGYYHNNSVMSHLAIEAGGGFNRPLGNSRSFATWGGQVMLGGGWNFNKSFGVLAEWQYYDNKIPGAYLANVGIPGGHIHTWGFPLEATYNLPTSGNVGGYIIGGGGFYRRVTTFTVPQTGLVCSFFCYYVTQNVPVAHYSSNQGGLNIGAGVTYKAFGEDSNGRIYAEARYVWVNSPSTNVFGTPDGTISFLPISFGVRW